MADAGIFYMEKESDQSKKYLMEKDPDSGKWKYYMEKEAAPDPTWKGLGTLTFSVANATTTLTMSPGDYNGGMLMGVFKGYLEFKIKYKSGSYYRGAVLNNYRTAVQFKTQCDFNSGPCPGYFDTGSDAVAGSQGAEMTLTVGADGVLYAGILSNPIPADQAGSVTFYLYGLK
jgi:hypothetical protein